MEMLSKYGAQCLSFAFIFVEQGLVTNCFVNMLAKIQWSDTASAYMTAMPISIKLFWGIVYTDEL